jgi:hypothetical protein
MPPDNRELPVLVFVSGNKNSEPTEVYDEIWKKNEF